MTQKSRHVSKQKLLFFFLLTTDGSSKECTSTLPLSICHLSSRVLALLSPVCYLVLYCTMTLRFELSCKFTPGDWWLITDVSIQTIHIILILGTNQRCKVLRFGDWSLITDVSIHSIRIISILETNQRWKVLRFGDWWLITDVSIQSIRIISILEANQRWKVLRFGA